MKYKVTNKLECPVRFKNITFGSKETKILDINPNTDRFIIEEIEIEEKPEKKQKGGKN